MANEITRPKSLQQLISTGDLSRDDKRTVAQFFTLIQQVFGSAKYRSMWETESDQKAAMALWAPDILRKSQAELAECIIYAKENMNSKDGGWINMALILEGRPPIPRPAWGETGNYVCKGIVPTKQWSWHKPDFERWGNGQRPKGNYCTQAEFDQRKAQLLAFCEQGETKQ